MKQLLHIILCIGLSIPVFAQADSGMSPQRKQKIQALYVAYVTQQLQLTELEAQKFWPVHAQFDAELKSVKPSLPELERQEASLNVRKKYQDRFVSILGASRTNDFFGIDVEFRKRLVNQWRKRQQGKNGEAPKPRRQAF